MIHEAMIHEAMMFHDTRGQYHIHQWYDLSDDSPTKRWHFRMFLYHVGRLGQLYNYRSALRRLQSAPTDQEQPHD